MSNQYTSFISSLQGIRDVISEIPVRDTIFLVASLDVDALASFHILSYIYQSDRFFGNYAALLVGNNNEITQAIEQNSDKTIFFLLNCGGQYRDFHKFQNKQQTSSSEENKHFFVLDSVRPFYLCNVYRTLQWGRNVHLLVDRDEDKQNRYHFVRKSFVDDIVNKKNHSSSSSSTSIAYDGGFNDGADDIQCDEQAKELVEKITKNPDEALNEDYYDQDDDDLQNDKELQDFIVHDEEEEEDDDDDEVEGNNYNGDDHDDHDERMANDNDSVMSDDLDDNYYATTSEERVILYNNSDGFSKPSAFLLYTFLDQQTVSISMRWAAILSLTYHYLFDRFADNEYPDYYFKLSSDNTYKSNEKSFDGISIPLDADYIKNNYYDLNIELMRHWTIYDACVNSTLVSRAFNTWQNHGIESMKLFISDLGLTLQDVTSNWLSLPVQTRETFFKSVKEKKNQYNLSSIVFNSFERIYEQSFSLTASDHVFALLGMMQIVPQQKLLTTISNSIINAKQNKLLIEQGLTKAKQMRQSMNDIFKSVMENKSYTHTREFVAIDLTNISLEHFNFAFSSQIENQSMTLNNPLLSMGGGSGSGDGSAAADSSPISPVAFYQLTQHFMKLVKYNKFFGRVHVILIKQQENKVYICGLNQNPQKVRTFNRAFEFACRTYNEPTNYSLFGSQVKLINKSKRSDIISVLLGSLVQSSSSSSKTLVKKKKRKNEMEDEEEEEEFEDEENMLDDDGEDLNNDDE